MKNKQLLAVIITALGLANVAIADPNAYEFKASASGIKASKDSQMDVQLLNKATGKLVPNATITAMRLDMAPSMADMATPVVQVSATQPSIYRFNGDVGYAGHWTLHLTATVPGETAPIKGDVGFEATSPTK